MRHKRLGINGQKAIRHLTLYLHNSGTSEMKHSWEQLHTNEANTTRNKSKNPNKTWNNQRGRKINNSTTIIIIIIVVVVATHEENETGEM